VTATVVDMPQHLSALRDANERRMMVSHLKLELRDGSISLAEALRSPAASGMRVYEVLLAVPRCGETKLRMILSRAGTLCGARCAFGVQPVSRLSSRQTIAIVDAAIDVLGATHVVGRA
jgi:hypothetical protein